MGGGGESLSHGAVGGHWWQVSLVFSNPSFPPALHEVFLFLSFMC